MKTACNILLFFVLFAATALPSRAQEAGPDNIFNILQQYDPLNVVLEIDLKVLRKERDNEKWHPAVFRIMAADTVAFERNVKVASRGNMRKKTCDYPPIKIRFYEKKPLDDSLADINELKLVINCRRSDRDEQLVLRENLAYELYNMITEESFRVKSATVQFTIPDRKRPTLESLAFFIESEKELASRLGGRPLKPRIISPRVLDSLAYARMSVFQYMIGNTDWGTYSRHNIKIIGFENRPPIAVPYDFDYAGIVDADYAVHSPDIPLKDVKERFFLGLCCGAALYQQVFDDFIARKNAILLRCEKYPGLSYNSEQDIQSFLKEFYKILENPRHAQKEIVEHCNYRVVKK